MRSKLVSAWLKLVQVGDIMRMIKGGWVKYVEVV